MTRYILFINRSRATGQHFSLDEAVALIAEAHRAGRHWDVRRKLRGERYRPLTGPEAAVVVQAATDKLALEEVS